jgi:hypothetical protein
VAFHLRVSQGAASGEAYSFTEEARLGRTADNDVVVKDQAASRSHARVFEQDGRYFVEDLGSANGTKLNDASVEQPQELTDGDSIIIGDTVFRFELNLDQNATSPQPQAAAVNPEFTNTDEEEPAHDHGAEEDHGPDEGGDTNDEPESTGDTDDQEVSSTLFVTVPKPKALASRAAVPQRLQRRNGAGSIEPFDEATEFTAADQARVRRQLKQSFGGRVQLLWKDLPRGARALIVIGGALLLVTTVGLAGYTAWPRAKVNRPEPKSLPADGSQIEDSFGFGKVTYSRADEKEFTFTATSPSRMVGVLHYQASDISADEVTVNLNGQDLGAVPPDNIDVESREIELVLPASTLKPRDENLIVFDNVRNPPGSDEWKIWNLWVEVIPVPDMSPEAARRRALAEIERASKDWELREVGAANLFRAWKTYREAWLLLEATPDSPPELLTLARTRMKEIRPELDRKCKALIVKFKSIVNTRPDAYNEGRQVLVNIPEHFPTREHPCFNFSRSLLRTLDGFDDFEAAGAPPAQ